jgi:tRNA(fMet)-specific endonuclease VapC
MLWLDRLELSKQAAEIHAYLRKTGRPIQDADILIAATALLNNLTVVTDDSDWLRVPELKVVNWLRE